MHLSILAFAAGIAWLQWQPTLPGGVVLGWLAVAALLLGGISWRWPRLRAAAPLAAFLFGIAWAAWLAQARLADALATELEGRDIEVVGVVASLPQRFENGLRFEFDVESAAATIPRTLSLAWYRGFRGDAGNAANPENTENTAPSLHAGERWRLTVRLKRPHGNWNPHGFDYEAWLFERGIRATGYVRIAEGNARLDGFVARPAYAIERLRELIRERFERVLGNAQQGEASYGGVLVALAIGDQRAIDTDLWRVFSRTGTTHLMSISGLHVTMVAAMAWWLASWLWRRSARLPLVLPAQKVAALAGFLAAFAYCLLAGFAVPAQRTLYMLGVVALALWSGRSIAGSRVLALALLLVLLLDPWAVLAAGFWLSFGAVGLLFYIGGGRLATGHWLVAWGRAQWAITFGMIPALLALFQQFSLASPIANAVAIPVVSFVVTPLALVGALPVPLIGDWLLWLSHAILAALMLLLEWLATSGWAVWQQHAPPAWAVIVGAGGTAWLLLPRGFPARWLGLVALLPLFLIPPERPAAGAARIVVLDVGQGLAVHAQTATHDLLFDTGPAFSLEANSGNRIIVPYLRAAGVRRLDGMIVSHADKDHSGGALSVVAEVPVGWLASSLPDDHEITTLPVARRRCVDGESWEWDGVKFEMIHPRSEDYGDARKTNDLSCVLKVTAAAGESRHAMLLTADIEARTESALVARHSERLPADVLLAPHHGSRTSSTPEFLAAVGAREAIFPVGYRNRFGHPKADVVARYAGARPWRTDRDGALDVRLGGEGVTIAAERAVRRRYWH